MEVSDLKNIFLLTAKRTIFRQYKYHKIDRTRLSEAEVRNVMARILEEKRIQYGIEIKTEKKFKHKSGTITKAALVDLVIYNSEKDDKPSIFIEFKRGQPSPHDIEKDLIKMVREPAHLKGSCFFHILPKCEFTSQNKLDRARRSIVNKYENAYHEILGNKRIIEKEAENRWFVLFILDGVKKQFYYYYLESLAGPFSCQSEWEYLKEHC